MRSYYKYYKEEKEKYPNLTVFYQFSKNIDKGYNIKYVGNQRRSEEYEENLDEFLENCNSNSDRIVVSFDKENCIKSVCVSLGHLPLEPIYRFNDMRCISPLEKYELEEKFQEYEEIFADRWRELDNESFMQSSFEMSILINDIGERVLEQEKARKLDELNKKEEEEREL